MEDVERRFTRWVDLVDDLLRCPGSEFPRALVTAELAHTFDTKASWNWVDADGSFGFEMHQQPDGWPTDAEMDFWTREAMPEHPLLRWYGATGDTTPMTAGRVPDSVATPRGRAMLTDCLASVGLDQQLSIPYRLNIRGHRAFVLGATGHDYPDEQLGLARRIQPLLVLLARTYAALEPSPPYRASHGNGSGPLNGNGSGAGSGILTVRELAVLRLLADGLTADAIGRRLGVSRHTVRKHLEHVYRKLGVTDRLVAVREARAGGLLNDQHVYEASAGARYGP